MKPNTLGRQPPPPLMAPPPSLSAPVPPGQSATTTTTTTKQSANAPPTLTPTGGPVKNPRYMQGRRPPMHSPQQQPSPISPPRPTTVPPKPPASSPKAQPANKLSPQPPKPPSLQVPPRSPNSNLISPSSPSSSSSNPAKISTQSKRQPHLSPKTQEHTVTSNSPSQPQSPSQKQQEQQEQQEQQQKKEEKATQTHTAEEIENANILLRVVCDDNTIKTVKANTITNTFLDIKNMFKARFNPDNYYIYLGTNGKLMDENAHLSVADLDSWSFVFLRNKLAGPPTQKEIDDKGGVRVRPPSASVCGQPTTSSPTTNSVTPVKSTTSGRIFRKFTVDASPSDSGASSAGLARSASTINIKSTLPEPSHKTIKKTCDWIYNEFKGGNKDINAFNTPVEPTKTEPIVSKLVKNSINFDEKTYDFTEVCIALKEYLNTQTEPIVPYKYYTIYCEQLGDTELSDNKFVDETRSLFALIPSTHKSSLSCILHFLNKMSRTTTTATTTHSSSDKQSSVNKETLDKMAEIFGPIIYRAPQNASKSDAGYGKQQAIASRSALLIDRIDKGFKAPSLDTSGDDAPLPSKPYPWFNSTMSAPEACAKLEGASSGTFFVMRNEEVRSEYKTFYVNSAGRVESIAIVKTSNGCWKKASDDFSLFVSLRSLIEYYMSIGYLKTPCITDTNASIKTPNALTTKPSKVKVIKTPTPKMTPSPADDGGGDDDADEMAPAIPPRSQDNGVPSTKRKDFVMPIVPQDSGMTPLKRKESSTKKKHSSSSSSSSKATSSESGKSQSSNSNDGSSSLSGSKRHHHHRHSSHKSSGKKQSGENEQDPGKSSGTTKTAQTEEDEKIQKDAPGHDSDEDERPPPLAPRRK